MGGELSAETEEEEWTHPLPTRVSHPRVSGALSVRHPRNDETGRGGRLGGGTCWWVRWEYILPRSLHSVADVRATRTEEKIGHSGPIGCAQGRRDESAGNTTGVAGARARDETHGLGREGLIECAEVGFWLDEVIMESSASVPSAPKRYSRVASPVHTILVLGVLGGWAVWHKISADHISAGADGNRVRYYLVTLLFEWLVVALVVAGVRGSGGSLLSVFGEHWRSAWQVLRDIGIAIGFWIAAAIILWGVGWLLHIVERGRMASMLPQRGSELAVWIALSVTAGICEETIFRGYLQRQFMALTKSAPAGIVLSAATFGAAHAYQGLRMTILIALYGAMFGVLAYWRRNVRPGMIAHAWQDSLNGVLAMLTRQ
jgi:membrane protease YdiL (CAAX protease family)